MKGQNLREFMKEPGMRPLPSGYEIPGEERHFDRTSWLTLAIGLSWFILLPTLMLVNFTFPSDGWTFYEAQNSGGYIVGMNVTGKPSPLQKGDLVIAINGQPYREDPLPPVPAHARFGQVIQYTVQRGEQTLTVDVTLIRRDALALWRGFVQMWQDEWRDLLVAFLSFLVAVFAFVARPRNRAAQYLFLIFSFYCALWIRFADWHPYVYAYPFPVNVLNMFFTFALGWYFFPTWTLLALTLPVLKAPLRRLPRLLPALLYGVPFTLSLIATSYLFATHAQFWMYFNYGVFAVVLAIFGITLLGSIIHNWLTLREPLARAQFLWVALGLGIGWGVGFVGALVFDIAFGRSGLGGLWYQISPWLSLLLPICLSIAITRYRLFDIEIIIRRTLVYSLLTLTLGLVYLGCILVSRALVAPLTGGSGLAIVASTLTIAALFNPLRRRIQTIIDKRFYRRKYDAAKVLGAFGATARDETNLDALTGELLRVVDETVQPEFAGLWLRDPQARSKTEAAQPDSKPPR